MVLNESYLGIWNRNIL